MTAERKLHRDQRQQYPEVEAKEIIARYPVARSALLPLLHLVQSVDGCVTPAGIEFCASMLELTGAEVAAVSTFYSMYRRTPCGDYLVGVCTNTLCAVLGGDEIVEKLAGHLGVGIGGTTPDRKVTVERVECNAACDYAPVVMVNWEFFDNQTPESIISVVNALREGKRVTATRGADIGTFKETSRLLAGFPDGKASGDPGAPTLAGLEAARGES